MGNGSIISIVMIWSFWNTSSGLLAYYRGCERDPLDVHAQLGWSTCHCQPWMAVRGTLYSSMSFPYCSLASCHRYDLYLLPASFVLFWCLLHHLTPLLVSARGQLFIECLLSARYCSRFWSYSDNQRSPAPASVTGIDEQVSHWTSWGVC